MAPMADLGRVLVVVGAALVYERPLWVADQKLHYEMWRGGIRSHVVTLPEGRVRYFEQGSGAPLVLIHGLSGRGEDFAGLMPKFAACSGA